MPKPKPKTKKATGKKQPLRVKTKPVKPVIAKQAVPAKKSAGKSGKTGPTPALTGTQTAGKTGKTGQTPALTREGIHVELGAQLTSKRGDEAQERAVIASAINAFMQLAIANGHPAKGSAYDAQCPEFFWEGDGKNPPVYARVPDATHDEIGRWFQFIVEGVRAYDANITA
jgi:hypothetical protein